MATAAPSFVSLQRPLSWLAGFLKEELAPYKGRAGHVARMVLAASLAMIVCMTFRISSGAFAGIFALLILQQNPRATLSAAAHVVCSIALSAAYILITVGFVISNPSLHFLWVMATFFLTFYLISTVNDYRTAATFGVLAAVTIPLWDRHVSAETNVEDTLRVLLAMLVGMLSTTAVELIFIRTKPGDEIVLPLAERLTAVEKALRCRASGEPAKRENEAVVRFALLGTSEMRRAVFRSGYSSSYRSQMGSVIVLVGRLVDLAATRLAVKLDSPESHAQELLALAAKIANLRSDLVSRQAPTKMGLDVNTRVPAGAPLLQEMENTVALVYQAFRESTSIYTPTEGGPSALQLFIPSAFSDPEHLKFALKGCCAAGACYVIYSGVDWRGISTAVTTCLVTALSTIGASRQKQALRFGGALVGGFIIGFGAQIFILPYLDSITGFAILFMAVTAVAAWFMTSSPRLSYFGLQIAIAFYLINLQEWAIQTSLAVARDRVVGILLGLFMMWLVFDRLGSAPAISEMKKKFTSVLRLLGQFEKEPLSQDLRVATERAFSLRETIGGAFDQVRALGDAVLFEFGSDREQNLKLRDAMIRWHSQLRILFLIRIGLWKYRAHVRGFELPEEVVAAQQAFDDRLAQKLTDLADRMEGKASATPSEALTADAFEQFEHVVRGDALAATDPVTRERLDTLLSLYHQTEGLVFSLDTEIAA